MLNSIRGPVLTGPTKEAAEAAIESIAASLLLPLPPDPARPPAVRDVAAASLPDGAAGIALFFGYLSRLRDPAGNADLASRFLEEAMDAVARQPMRPALLGGYGGIGWVAEHLTRVCLVPDGDDPLADLDLALSARLGDGAPDLDYDLVSGLVGLGIVALERHPRPAAAAILERVVDELYRRAERPEGHARWFTHPRDLPPRDREAFPDGYYVLGVAHGIAAVLVVLSGAVARGVAAERARELLEAGVRFLLSVDDPDRPFPYWTGPGVPPSRSRLAWCHGDPGIGIALLTAARAVGEPKWEAEAVRILLRAARTPPDRAGAVEAGLCHGTSGLAHVFGRAYRLTQEPEFCAASAFWFERTIRLLQEDDVRSATGGVAEIPRGFLMGRAGVGLALIGAVAPIEPEWDRVLAMSLPSPAGGTMDVRA